MSHSSTTHSMTVSESRLLTPDTLSLLLKPDNDFPHHSGQYIQLGLTPDDLKPFSIASAPREDGQIECHIRRYAQDDWMSQLFPLKPGDRVFVSGPHDQYLLPHNLPEDQPIIFVAGGTGYAPMKALLQEALRRELKNPIHFYWGAKNPVELYEDEAMQALAKAHGIRYITVLSEAEDTAQGLTGWVHLQVLKDLPDLSGRRVFLCGPWGMQETAKQDFLAAGLAESDFN